MQNDQLVILVTGASGFTAEHLIPILRAEGHYVIGIDRAEHPSEEVDLFYSLDLCDISEQFFAPYKIDLVIHLAAARADWGVTDEEFMHDNVKATAALTKFCKDNAIQKFIFASSIAVYPQDNQEPISEQSPTEPLNIYGKSKLLAENILIEHTHVDTKFCLNIIRPTVLYGPSDPNKTGIYRAMDNNIFRLIDGIYKKRFAFIGSSKTIKSTAYIKNFVEAIIFLLPNQPGYEIFIYSDQPPWTTVELVKTVRKLLGKSGLGPRLPLNFTAKIAKALDYLGPKTGINFPITQSRVNTFNRSTNFIPQALVKKGFVQKYSTNEGLGETVLWYRKLIQKHNLNTFLFRNNK